MVKLWKKFRNLLIYNSFDNIGLKKVLSFLKSHNEEYLSGQDLSEVLKISRVAVWKHIKKIRELGYKVESKQKLGYKLIENTNTLLPWEVSDQLNTKVLGKRVYYFDTIDSTQNFALEIAKNPKENGTVVIAEEQTKGRGRLGRKWNSPKGGIWISIIFQPKFEVSKTTIFPIAASVALAVAIEKTLKIKPELKWPNDVTLKGKKVAGMIVDLSIESNKTEFLVLGAGIDFLINAKSLEKSLKKAPNFYGATSLVSDNQVKPIQLVQSFLSELEKYTDLINLGKNQTIIQCWSKRSSTLGKTVKIKTGNDIIQGKATKLDSEGALIVSNGKEKRLLAGDVTYSS